MNLEPINTNESLLECPFSAWKVFSYLFNFTEQGEPVMALISRHYIKEGNFKTDEKGKKKGKVKLCLKFGSRKPVHDHIT